jgi:hypothetical protein
MNPTKWMVVLGVSVVILSLTWWWWPKSLQRQDLADKMSVDARGSSSTLIPKHIVHDVPWDELSIFVPYSNVPPEFVKQGVDSTIGQFDNITLWVFTNKRKVTAWFELTREVDIERNLVLPREKSNLHIELQFGGSVKLRPY